MPIIERNTRTRIIRLLRLLVEQPKRYTLRQLALKFGFSEDTIRGDLAIFQSTGFITAYDEKYRYYLKEEQPYQQLKDLLHFTEEDQRMLWQAIDTISPNYQRGRQLKQKLSSLYDYNRLGNSYLRKPYLNKVDTLLQAKEQKRKVLLQNYRSGNSNVVSDRTVEPFHPSPPEDILHAWDVDKNELRHYRISRIGRVKLLEETWTHENRHQVLLTDPFRIVDNNQVMVRLRMKVGAYNELVERFPLTRSYIEEAEEDIYDLQCMVNHRFIGLTNFILGYHHQLVEVVYPESLIEHLRDEIGKMQEVWRQ